jgi:nitrite reductase/ring-hydroxylating ferredoxin subunit
MESTPQPAPTNPERRSALKWVAALLGALATAAVGIPVIGYLLGTLFQRKPDQWVDIGAVVDFPIDDTRSVDFPNPDRQALDGVTGRTTAYVRRVDGGNLGVQVSNTRGGARVDRVIDGSLTSSADLRAGDVIVKLDDTPIEDAAGFVSAVAARRPGETVTLTRSRNGREDKVPVKIEDRFMVFAVDCAHLGCPVSWFPQSGLFMCPCHGGVYYSNGERASGPPPRGLYRYPYGVRLLPEKPWEARRLQILAGHLPTLQNTLGGSGEKAS